jgi:hypothetical protein
MSQVGWFVKIRCERRKRPSQRPPAAPHPLPPCGSEAAQKNFDTQ